MLQEAPLFPKSWHPRMKRVSLVFPNLYYGGVYNFGLLTLYNLINQRKNWICERSFLDAQERLVPADLIGFTFQYELDYYNFFSILEQHDIPSDKHARKEILFAGGPCISINPSTLSAYFDFFLLGDCEESIHVVLDVYEKTITKGKSFFLTSIAHLPGVFVPDISTEQTYGSANLPETSYPYYQPLPKHLDKRFVFGNAFLLELERSCPYRCNFCSIPRMYTKLQYRPFDQLKEIIDEGHRITQRTKFALYTPSFTHPKRKEILQYLLDKQFTFTVPSFRVEYLDAELLALIRKGGQKSLTVAPECGQTLRNAIGKSTKDAQFFSFFQNAQTAGFQRLKLYMLVGIPGQTKEDLQEMISFVKEARKTFSKSVYLSVNPFVPKPKSPFADHQFDKKHIKGQLLFLKKELHQLFRIKIADLQNSSLEWKLAQAPSFEPFAKLAIRQSTMEMV